MTYVSTSNFTLIIDRKPSSPPPTNNGTEASQPPPRPTGVTALHELSVVDNMDRHSLA